MDIDIISFPQHLEQYMPEMPFNISFGNSPIKVIALEEIRQYLKYPTALFKPQYNIIIHITNGTVEARVGYDKIVAKKHSVLLMLSNKIISRDFLSYDLKGFGIIIEDSAFSKLLSKSQLLKILEINPHILLSEKDNMAVTGLNNILLDESKIKDSNHDFIHVIIQGVLYKLLGKSKLTGSISRNEEIAFGFKQLAFQHFQREHNIAFYANKLNISESYLNRCVKAVFRKSSKEIWTKIIIQHSQVLLQDTSKEIAEVAYILHFADPSYFGRLFKKITGITPTHYRKHNTCNLSD